jgi:hypothetical protein
MSNAALVAASSFCVGHRADPDRKETMILPILVAALFSVADAPCQETS